MSVERVCIEERKGKRGVTYKAWTRLRRRLGIPHARLHDLRDTFASGLANANVNAFLTASMTGHANIATTNQYLHQTIRHIIAFRYESLNRAAEDNFGLNHTPGGCYQRR